MTHVATEREAFEAWYAKRHPVPTHENSTWAHASKMDDWEVWQARAVAAPAAVAPWPQGEYPPLPEATAYGNRDELDNMLDDRSATVHGKADGWRGTPLFDAAALRAYFDLGRQAAPALEAPAALVVALPAMPPTDDRRPYDDAEPEGYMESDNEWLDRNLAAVRWFIDNHAAIRAALAAAPQAPRLGEDALHLLHRLLSNQHTLTGPEFRAELEKIVAEESARHAAAPQAPAAPLESGPAGSGGWESHALQMERERDHWRDRARVMSEHKEGVVWYWQGDGEDHPESWVNTLPVVIRADELRALMGPAAPAAPAVDALDAARWRAATRDQNQVDAEVRIGGFVLMNDAADEAIDALIAAQAKARQAEDNLLRPTGHKKST